MLSKVAPVAAAVVLGTAAMSASAANLVQNGSFASGTTSGWTTTGNYKNNLDGVSSFLGKSAFTFGNYAYQGAAGVKQSVATTSGQTYDVSFEWAVDDTNSASNELIQVLWDGTVKFLQAGASASGWNTFSFLATGTGTDTLTIQGFAQAGYNYVTDVSVTPVSAVPEPETYSMLLAGLGLMGTMVKRRKRNQA